MEITSFLERCLKFDPRASDFTEYLSVLSKPFWEALKKESDRAIVIIVACLLDNLLEELIRASYIKEPQVKYLFKNDHILQSFFAKINIAYFSGLIPKFVYHDLKSICEIRNKFAHEITGNLNFSTRIIEEKINSCDLRPRTLDDVSVPRLKFILIVQIIVAYLGCWERDISQLQPPHLVELLGMKNIPFDELALTRKEISDIIRKERAKSLRNKKKVTT